MYKTYQQNHCKRISPVDFVNNLYPCTFFYTHCSCFFSDAMSKAVDLQPQWCIKDQWVCCGEEIHWLHSSPHRLVWSGRMSLLLHPWCITQGSSSTLSLPRESSRTGQTLRARVRINVASLMKMSWLKSQSSTVRTWWFPRGVMEPRTIRLAENKAGKRREGRPCKRRRNILGMAITRAGTSETPCGGKRTSKTLKLVKAEDLKPVEMSLNLWEVTGKAASYVPQDGPISLLVITPV